MPVMILSGNEKVYSVTQEFSMKEDEYLKDRLEDQLIWYDQKSLYNQKCFKGFRLLEIITAALIPFLSGMLDQYPRVAWVIGGLGVVIAVSAATSTLFKFHENWIEYRMTAEQLRHEKYAFLTDSKPYDNEDKFGLLVERVEALISKENSAWATVIRQQTSGIKSISQ